jgi:hypothetical protein
MNNPDHISESLETVFGLIYLNSLMGIRDGKSRIRDPGWKKFESRINIPDPQHGKNCLKLRFDKNFFVYMELIRAFD